MRSHRAVGTKRRSARRAGHVAEQGHQGAAAQAATVELEQLGEHARDHALADDGAGPAVPGDAGGRQLVLDEPGVGLVGREQHGDAVEAGAGAGGVDDGTDTDAHLVVGVGGRHDGDVAVGTAVGRDRGRQRVTGERRGEGDDPGVGVGVAGDPDDDLERAALGQRGEQLTLERAQSLGEVDDDAPEAVGQVVPGARRRPDEEVALVVPLAVEQRGDVVGHPRRLRAARRAGECGHRARPGGAELAVQLAKGDDRRRVVVDAGVDAWRLRGWPA